MEFTAFEYKDRISILDQSLYSNRDYFSYLYDEIGQFVKDNFKYFEHIEIDDNDRLEVISYNRYESENYADLIVMINQANFMWMLPYDGDIQLSIGESYSNYLTMEINNTNNESKEEFIKEYGITRAQQENSEKRLILVPRIENLQTVVSLLEKYRSQNEIK
jgi:hypothetical protein